MIVLMSAPPDTPQTDVAHMTDALPNPISRRLMALAFEPRQVGRRAMSDLR